MGDDCIFSVVWLIFIRQILITNNRIDARWFQTSLIQQWLSIICDDIQIINISILIIDCNSYWSIYNMDKYNSKRIPMHYDRYRQCCDIECTVVANWVHMSCIHICWLVYYCIPHVWLCANIIRYTGDENVSRKDQ